jgi:hypothetical protein
MPTPAPLDESDGHVNEVPLPSSVAPPPPKLQVKARRSKGVIDPSKAAQTQQRREASQRLLKGGVSKGEQRGFGLASYPRD